MKRNIAIGVAVAAAAGGGGAALAATSSKSDIRTAFLADVAKRLDVTPDKLNSALQGAYLDRLQAAVTAGRLTQAQADAIKKRVQDGDFPIGVGGDFGGRTGDKFGHHPGGPGLGDRAGGPVSAAATFLGLDQTELRTALQSGKSLADVAKEKGKSEDDLIAAIVTAEKKKLDAAVADDRLTSDQRDTIVKDLPARIKALVEGGPPVGGPGDGPWGPTTRQGAGGSPEEQPPVPGPAL